MVDHFAKLPAGKVAIGMDGVPVFFVHVVAWYHFGMLFAEFDGAFGVALHVKAGRVRNAGEQEKFFADLKHKGILAEGQALGHTRFCEAIITYLF